MEEAEIYRSLFRSVSTDQPSSRTGGAYIPPRSSGRGFTYSPRGNFVEQAKEYVDRTEPKARHVPFQHYWPTYSVLNKRQTKWYFYWRTELRRGNKLSTDLSYLFIHIYEVINLIDFKTRQSAFEHLVALWKHYRTEHPTLDNYMPDWIADFIVIHKLPKGALPWYAEVAQLADMWDGDLLVEAWFTTGSAFAALSRDTLYRLADYNPTRSKFYEANNDDGSVDAAHNKGLQAVDAHLKATSGKSLLEHFKPSRKRTIKREPFRSAVHTYQPLRIEVATVHAWYTNEELSAAVKDIIKYSENVLREQNGYRYKLRDIELPDAWKQAIEDALALEPPKREVSIDLAAVEQLKEESAAIRERLIVADEQEPTQPKPQPPHEGGLSLNLDEVERLKRDSEVTRSRLIVEEEEEGDDAPAASSPSAHDKADAPSENTGTVPFPDELDETWREFAAQLKPHQWTVLTILRMGDDVDTRINAIAMEQHLMGSMLLDAINEIALETVGDILIDTIDSPPVVTEYERAHVDMLLEWAKTNNLIEDSHG